ncbi:MAG: hypothetical protein LBI28_04335 [Treponema sp.]|nr:hypothetical protein [Treponema sp.]
MAEREEDWAGNVSYKDSSGDSHHSEYDANNADANKQAATNAFHLGGGSKGKDFTDYAMEWAIKAFIFGPILFAKLVGWIWGMLLKLGFPGRIVTTILMLFAGPMILGFPVMMISSMGGGATSGIATAIMTTIMAVFMVGAAVIPTAWYYIWHYDAVKLMGATVFSHIIQNFAKFFWFGFIGAGLISMASPGVGGFLALAVSAAGFIYYFKATKEYRQEAKANPSINFSTATKSIIFTVVLVILAGTGTLTILGQVASAVKNKVEAAKLATAAGKFTQGMNVEVTKTMQIYDPANGGYTDQYGAPITDKAKPYQFAGTNTITYAKAGEILTVTGKAENEVYNNWLVPVEYKGIRGYIEMENITQTNKSPPAPVATPAVTAETDVVTDNLTEEQD